MNKNQSYHLQVGHIIIDLIFSIYTKSSIYMHIFQPSFRLYSLNTHAKKIREFSYFSPSNVNVFVVVSFYCYNTIHRLFLRSLVVKSEVNLLPKMEVSKLRTKRVKKGDFVGISCKLFFIWLHFKVSKIIYRKTAVRMIWDNLCSFRYIY